MRWLLALCFVTACSPYQEDERVQRTPADIACAEQETSIADYAVCLLKTDQAAWSDDYDLRHDATGIRVGDFGDVTVGRRIIPISDEQKEALQSARGEWLDWKGQQAADRLAEQIDLGSNAGDPEQREQRN